MPAIVIAGGTLVCVASLVIGGLFLLPHRAENREMPAVVAKPSIEAQLVDNPIEGNAQPAGGTPKPASNMAVFTATGSPTVVVTSAPVARFGEICFAMIEPDGDTGPCADTFPPVEEMHAIFDYSGMSSQDQWTRIWYHNGQELLSVQEIWSGDAEGRFDYNLNTSERATALAGAVAVESVCKWPAADLWLLCHPSLC